MSFLTLGEVQFMEEAKTVETMLALVVKGVESASNVVIPRIIQQMLEEYFGDIVPVELPTGLPVMWDIQHQIN
jgi:hypothetical protein